MDKISTDLSSEEITRYGRQLIQPEIGLEGQLRLKNSSVLVVGIGGLGSAASLYLAAAGVGRIGLMDKDRVELSNLQRQIMYDSRQIGDRKAISAAEKIRLLNTHICTDAFDMDFREENARQVASGFDILLDCSDNYSTRLRINEFCVRSGKPEVFGAVDGFEGQIGVFDSRTGPCYCCFFPKITFDDNFPSQPSGGVVSPLPGVIGSLMAVETIKLLLHTGQSLVGHFLVYDGLDGDIRRIKVNKRTDCPVCSKSVADN